MDKGTKRAVIDVIEPRQAFFDAREQGCRLEVLQQDGPTGVPECSLYGPRDNVNALLKAWGYEDHVDAGGLSST